MCEAPPPSLLHYVGLVIEDESGVQGFLVGQAHADEWELQSIAVRAAGQRRGFGGQLLTEFLEQARERGVKSVYLEVRQSNQAARAFYKNGYFRKADDEKTITRALWRTRSCIHVAF